MDPVKKQKLIKALKLAKLAVPIALIILSASGVIEPNGGDEDPEDPAVF